jgi:hypothetical protein
MCALTKKSSRLAEDFCANQKDLRFAEDVCTNQRKLKNISFALLNGWNVTKTKVLTTHEREWKNPVSGLCTGESCVVEYL